jgi:adenylosuccinate lyase
MIRRYRKEKIADIFGVDGEGVYRYWLAVELAVLYARVEMGKIPAVVADTIKSFAEFNVERIEEIEAVLKHDLQAFVENVRESPGIPEEYKKHIHEDMTSFDTEEPATSCMIREATRVVVDSLNNLLDALKGKALKYKFLFKIQRTHGQHAQPTTFGLELLWWYDALDRQSKELRLAFQEMRYSKISGAVGTYWPRLSPELERIALDKLGLLPAPISAQINLRDRLARIMNALAVIMSTVEHVAENLRLYGQTEICEVQEPFGKGQKGSSAMPHKKNTILSENLCGQARNARHFAAAIMEAIPTWGARDIDHSATERVFVPDMFHTVVYSLDRLTGIINGMVVHEDRMAENLNFSRGVIYSPEVKDMLAYHGMSPAAAYAIAQRAAFQAIEEKRSYIDTLLGQSDFPRCAISRKDLEDLFDHTKTVQYIEEIFERVLG